jgi:dTDP-4-amino-4,6-dideoxygalactose transaminase
MIPFSPPRIDQKTIDAVTESLQSGWISTGPKTKQFEENLATYLQTDHMVCLNSATAGMQLILNWLGIQPGDEVIVPAYTYCATANVVIHRGATPVMVDINSDDFNINVEAIKAAITDKTKAIISVDVGGVPVDYDEINALIRSSEVLSKFSPRTEIQEQLGRIMFVSDAAHSIGAKYKGKYTGHQADMSSFSFHAVKNLTTAEGGAVIFNVADKFEHETLKKKFKVSSLHGQTKDAFSKLQIGAWRYDVIEAGYKCNMTDLNAAIGLVELDRYDESLARRKSIFDQYTEGLSSHNWALTPFYEDEEKTTSYHLYQLRIKGISEDKRDQIITEISQNEVAVNVHYIPVPMLTFYKNQGHDISNYPNAYAAFENEITLPVYYSLSDENVKTVIDTVVNAVNKVLGL